MPPDVIYPAGYPASRVPYPVATGPFIFTGFYAGANVGGVLGGTKYLETPSGAFGAAAASVAAVGTSSTAPRGVLGGLEAGYNWQLGYFVLGIETDFSGWDMSSNSGMSAFGTPPAGFGFPPGITYTSSGTVTSNWLYTLRPRVGFANGNMLTYLTAGLAVTNLRFSEFDRSRLRRPVAHRVDVLDRGGLDGRRRRRICAVVQLVHQGGVSLRELLQPDRLTGDGRLPDAHGNDDGQSQRQHSARRLRLPVLIGPHHTQLVIPGQCAALNPESSLVRKRLDFGFRPAVGPGMTGWVFTRGPSFTSPHSPN